MTDTTQTQGTAAGAERPGVETLSFEQAQAELEQVVEALEDRHTGLDDALALWERGEALHAWCQSRLDYAAERLQKLSVTAEDVAAVTAESGDEFAPEGAVPAAAAEDPAPATTPADPSAVDTIF
ncbi:MAG: exodeoxyribonuclease small subunit [Thermoleophilia bacterium]|nr:exodeoxyribonuclease small subunit [Thermoleophilia bacterium]